MLRRTFVLALLATAVLAGRADAAVVTYPGCAPTLLECIREAPRGSTIRLRTNRTVEIESGEILVRKPLELVAARGFHPNIESESGTTDLEFRISAPRRDFTVRGIRLTDVTISIYFADGAGHRAVVERNRFRPVNVSNGDRAIDIDYAESARGSTRVANNVFRGDGTAVEVSPGGRTEIIQNRITGTENSANGIEIVPVASRSVRVIVASNLINHVQRCNCGSPSGILARGGGTLNLQVLGNTINDVGLGGMTNGTGINIHPPTAPARTRATIQNNTVTDATSGIVIYASDRTEARGDRNNTDTVNGDSIGTHDLGTFIHADPQFVNPAAGNFRLGPGSPLTNAGLTCEAAPLPRADAAGTFRLAGDDVDVGAYERGSRVSGNVRGRNISGSDGANRLTGTRGRDIICGLGGSDRLLGGDERDLVFGGLGNDFLKGQDGQDRLVGDAGNDRAYGGRGADRLELGDGVDANDRGYGGPGIDSCSADDGDALSGCP